ncbi:MAG: HPr family phosphocarrier protein [Desulfobacteraceae bacterium]|nr:HPr family phosphocarrier protein [Desulfobacteraceae bacterium]MBC2755987.1 HPr family phosphocarrier protein [Desulfobacteraceae bacterium]
MNEIDHNLSRKTTVINELGLHARPAAMLANLALKAQSDVWLCKNGEEVDASSIIDILSLACLKGANVALKVENPEDIDILNEMINLFEKGFRE